MFSFLNISLSLSKGMSWALWGSLSGLALDDNHENVDNGNDAENKDAN